MSQRQIINPGWDRYKKLTYCPAVRKGNMIFISGQDGTQIDQDTGKMVIKGSMTEQARIAYGKIKAILESAGASFDDVVWTTDYITTTENYRDTAEVRRQIFGGSFPASTGIVVKELLHKQALIEIDAVAILD